MDLQQIEQLLTEQLQLSEVYVKADGSHYAVTAVGSCFADVSRVKQQQMVYAPLMQAIADGSIHARSIFGTRNNHLTLQWAVGCN